MKKSTKHPSRASSTDQPSTLLLQTSWGMVGVLATRMGVIAVNLPQAPDATDVPLKVKTATYRLADPRDRAILATAEKFIRATLAGKRAASPKLAFPSGSPVQLEVWRYLHQMKRGEVVTYGELAKKIKRPRAARAIGQACGANPIPLMIPCHRVLAADGRLGGYSGGLAWKTLLLAGEKSLPAIHRSRRRPG